ncbi:MAG: 4Fe-4S binding protein [Chloroflexota bacterium]|nr:4Fe-4S binding protein [Chloroflexota bacterium]
MPGSAALNPLILVKFVLWIAMVVAVTVLLHRRKATSKVRLVFLVGGVLIFGFLFGLLIPGGLNPNPVASLRTLVTSILVRGQLVIPVAAMLGILLVAVWVSNKSICGWACQLGLLQDLLHRVELPKWEPPFWLSNSVRILAFVALLGGLIVAGMDWIGVIDPFLIFSFDVTWAIGLFSGALLIASLFAYRPWCRFLCPFGLIGWLVEQVSLMRPRMDRDVCQECTLCVKACPSGAMGDFYADAPLHADCFACGACIEACPQEGTLEWRAKA